MNGFYDPEISLKKRLIIAEAILNMYANGCNGSLYFINSDKEAEVLLWVCNLLLGCPLSHILCSSCLLLLVFRNVLSVLEFVVSLALFFEDALAVLLVIGFHCLQGCGWCFRGSFWGEGFLFG